MEKTVKLNKTMSIKLSNTIQLINELQKQMNTLIEGYKDALELEGDWRLNTQTWEMTKITEGPPVGK